jgi:hypothetical protein
MLAVAEHVKECDRQERRVPDAVCGHQEGAGTRKTVVGITIKTGSLRGGATSLRARVPLDLHHFLS